MDLETVVKKKLKSMVMQIQYDQYKYISPPLKFDKLAADPIEKSLGLRMRFGSHTIKVSKEEASTAHNINEEPFELRLKGPAKFSEVTKYNANGSLEAALSANNNNSSK